MKRYEYNRLDKSEIPQQGGMLAACKETAPKWSIKKCYKTLERERILEGCEVN